jgi:hypothetical protein
MPIDPNTLASVPLEELLSQELMASAMQKMSEVVDFDSAFKAQYAQRQVQRTLANEAVTEAQAYENYRRSAPPPLSETERVQRDMRDEQAVVGSGVQPYMADNRTPGEYVGMLAGVPQATEDRLSTLDQLRAERRLDQADGLTPEEGDRRRALNSGRVHRLPGSGYVPPAAVGEGDKRLMYSGGTIGGHQLWGDRPGTEDAMEGRFGRLDDLRLREGPKRAYRAMAGTYTDPNDFIGQLAGQLALQRRRALGPDDPSMRALAEGTIDTEDLSAYPPGPML